MYITNTNKTMKEIVDIVSKKQPEKIDNLKKMFEVYVMKSQMLQSYYGVKKEDRDKVAIEIMNFLMTVKTQFIESWCMAEHSMEVIKHLEEEIVKLGGNLDTVRQQFNSKL